MNGIETTEAIIEAILFAAGDAVALERLENVLETDRDSVLRAVQALADRYDFERCGIMLARMENKVQLCSRPDYADYVRRATESRRPPSLSPASLEVLSIVAYRQPVTRAFIEQVRGVDSSGTVASLVEKGLIEEYGRLDVPGRPVLFRTTPAFLRTISISSLEELPSLPELTGTEGEQLRLAFEEPTGGAKPEAGGKT
ncbi:MAG: SMC-Scp complex subunit ScpB [Intestinibacillus sp.]